MHKNLETRTAEMWNQFQHEKQKGQEAINYSVSQFFLRSQEGWDFSVETIVKLHNQFLGI